ncbi:MAG: hypothetical protein IPM35_38750 [Myxococcales bacterium]|nr:hypothetical protein [Myxococcales bacterium]
MSRTWRTSISKDERPTRAVGDQAEERQEPVGGGARAGDKDLCSRLEVSGLTGSKRGPALREM